MATALFGFIAALLLHVGVAQEPVPSEPPGFTIGRGSGSAKALANHYEPEDLRVKAVLFPLPFHQHGFTAAESVFTITSALGDDHFTPWLEVLYNNQERFWNKATKDLSAVQVTNEVKELAKKTFPALTDKQWEKGMTGYGGTEADQNTRVTWKYACTRTVTGTPQYKSNGVPFEDADSSWKLEDWLKVIDPLVKADKPKYDL
ncbi:hypothetical protein PInf_025907 [Phytophthora infestans]|nr:hypothetical protein PInf_025907 [Phytophthora infestans]